MVRVMPGWRDSRSFRTSPRLAPSTSTTAWPSVCFRRIVGSFTFTAISVLPSHGRRDPVLRLLRHAAGRDPTEQVVVDELGHGGLVAAHRAGRVALDLHGLEVHLQRVEDQEAAHEGLADP